MHWLQLIRWKNLVIVFVTQLLVWYCLLWYPGGLLDVTDFLPLGISTVLIAAAGYIINDYFDIKIDLINRPEKMVLEKHIPLRAAIIAHVTLNVAGLGMAVASAMAAHKPQWSVIQIACIALLWFYSTHFKRQFMTGNIVVAILTALTVLVMAIYAPAMAWSPAMNWTPYRGMPYTLNSIQPMHVLYSFAFFAFMLTWMREIVKDMEDFKGDAEDGCMTMPIKKGLQFSARFAQVLGVITIAVLAVIAFRLYTTSHILLAGYTILCLIAPLGWWCIFLTRQNTTAHYAIASKGLKFIMIAGICSLIVYHFTTAS